VGTDRGDPPWDAALRFVTVAADRPGGADPDAPQHQGAGIRLELISLGPLDRALELESDHEPDERADRADGDVGIAPATRHLLAATAVIDGSRVLAALATDLETVARAWPAARLARSDRAGSGGLRGLLAMFERPVPILIAGRPLRRQVLIALGRLPLGAVVTYGALAAAVGAPRAVRAVASMVGANPVPVLLGCHRVVPAIGGVGRYVWGSTVKQQLLASEGVTLVRTPSADATPSRSTTAWGS